jgi:hypothetical protein
MLNVDSFGVFLVKLKKLENLVQLNTLIINIMGLGGQGQRILFKLIYIL